MKTQRLIEALNRVSRGQSNIIDARALRDEMIAIIMLALPDATPPNAAELKQKLDALRELRL